MTPVHEFGNLVREAFAAIPLGLARALFLATILAVLVWVVTLPPTAARPAEPAARWYNDLRLWAALALLFQLAIYSIV